MKLTSALLIGLILVLSGFAGCAVYRPLQIEPVSKRKVVAPIVPKFTTSYFYFDRDKNLFFILRDKTTDKDTHQAVDQILTVRVFWRPIGGTTSLNNSSLNATFRYVLMTPDSVAMYEGAGFVRLTSVEAKDSWSLFHKYGDGRYVNRWVNGKSILQARVMDGDLRLTESSVAFNDTLGRAHLRGNLTLKYDDIRAFDLLMEAHREFFARSLLSKPPATATEPGEPRDENNSWPLEPAPGPIIEPPATGSAPPATQP